MKKQQRPGAATTVSGRLTLNRETIRVLDPARLAEVVGAGTFTEPTNCTSISHVTTTKPTITTC